MTFHSLNETNSKYQWTNVYITVLKHTQQKNNYLQHYHL